MDFAARFDQGLKYADFLSHYGNDDQRARWQAFHQQVELTSAQRELLASFKRQMKVLCLAGAWCGDCVNQCPIFDHFTRHAQVIDLRFFDRDANPELAGELKICGGARVPVVVFLSEDGHEVGRYGDRTLSKYRQMIAERLGPSCPTGLAIDGSLTSAVVQDWLNEFERVQWILRTSARLRALHND
jgi:hypothetical protein